MHVKIPERNMNFASLKSYYHRLANRRNLILPDSEIFQNFLCHLQFFNVGEIMMGIYHLMLLGAFTEIKIKNV